MSPMCPFETGQSSPFGHIWYKESYRCFIPSNDGALNAKLDGLVGSGGRKPTARVVFDEGVAAREYVAVVESIASHAVVMGELLDSFYVADYGEDDYRRRACEYRAEIGALVDIWEVGNDVASGTPAIMTVIYFVSLDFALFGDIVD